MFSIGIWVIIFFISLTVHEACHGYVANYLGDPTAKQQGRLSLNPLKHIDPFWTIIFPVFLYLSTGGRFTIGMAKPVPVDFSRLKNPKNDMIWVALAGPLANILLAGVLNILYKFMDSGLLLYAIYFNLGLAMFNAIPIPPLDGSRMVAGLLPLRWARAYLRMEPYGFLIIFFLYLGGYLFDIILPWINFFCRLFDIPGLRFS